MDGRKTIKAGEEQDLFPMLSGVSGEDEAEQTLDFFPESASEDDDSHPTRKRKRGETEDPDINPEYEIPTSPLLTTEPSGAGADLTPLNLATIEELQLTLSAPTLHLEEVPVATTAIKTKEPALDDDVEMRAAMAQLNELDQLAKLAIYKQGMSERKEKGSLQDRMLKAIGHLKQIIPRCAKKPRLEITVPEEAADHPPMFSAAHSPTLFSRSGSPNQARRQQEVESFLSPTP
jgi:hypothetical protein